MRFALAILLGLSLAACGGDVEEKQASNVYGDSGALSSYSVTPAAPDTAEAFLADTAHAGNFTAGGAVYRVFELYEDERIEIAIARTGRGRSVVWNLSETIGVGIDEIESIHEAHGQLDLWVYEEGGVWAIYNVVADERELRVERSVYAEYAEPGSGAQPIDTDSYAVRPSNEARYALLPSFEKISVVNFTAPTLGSARIYQLAEEEGSRVLVSLRVGNGPDLVYDTNARVKDVLAAEEVEPGYFDMQADPLCTSADASCRVPFDAIGIRFELSADGRSLASETIVVELKQGVG